MARAEIHCSLESTWLCPRGWRRSLIDFQTTRDHKQSAFSDARERSSIERWPRETHLESVSGKGTLGILPLGVREDCAQGDVTSRSCHTLQEPVEKEHTLEPGQRTPSFSRQVLFGTLAEEAYNAS